MFIGTGLDQRLKAVGHQLLKDVAYFPFAAGNPLPVRRRFHRLKCRFHRRLEPSPHLRADAILVHSDLLSYGCLLTVASVLSAFAKKDGQTHLPGSTALWIAHRL
jgi:hypothetical protein